MLKKNNESGVCIESRFKSEEKAPKIKEAVIRLLRENRLPYKRPMSKKGFFAPYEYVYDEYFNCVICPENRVLNYATTNREGYREFKSKGYVCENCPDYSQ